MRKLAITLTLMTLSLGWLGSEAHADNHLSEKEIKRVVTRHADEVKRCYVRYALRQKSAEGRVTLAFVVTPEGNVKAKTIDVEAPGVRGQRFPRCVKRSVTEWKFPQARASTAIEYPFYFQHTRAKGAGPRR